MKVSDILRIKGNTLFTVQAGETLKTAIAVMAEKDIGSLVVVEHGDLAGMFTFREVILALAQNRPPGSIHVRSVMNDSPLICTPETDMEEVSRMMLKHHARYMPVMDQKMLMGIISFHDMAHAVVSSQDFENRLLKAFIRQWPQTDGGEQGRAA